VSDFTCAWCERTFQKGRSDEEAMAEASRLWGDLSDPDVICDECFIARFGELPAEGGWPDPFAELQRHVDEYRASLDPVRRFVYDDLQRAMTELMLTGNTTLRWE